MLMEGSIEGAGSSKTGTCLAPCPYFGLVWFLTALSPEVNELLMEAQLLQVSLPEIQELYQTLLAKPSAPQLSDRSSPAWPSGEKVGICRLLLLLCRGHGVALSGLPAAVSGPIESHGVEGVRSFSASLCALPESQT